MRTIRKYPRTRHLEGSRLQPGDEDLGSVPFADIAGRHLVVEEKMDGANCALSFDEHGRPWLQSRGHYLTGGRRERHFALLKAWAARHRDGLWPVLGRRYVMYGEWVYAKHTVFYDRLPHYFLEFDILDLEGGEFLSTPRRRELLAAAPVVSVPVLAEDGFGTVGQLTALVGPSLYKGPEWRASLAEQAAAAGVDPGRAAAESDPSDLAEGLYVKLEEDGRVVERFKWVRHGFLQAVADSGSHWLDRTIIPNRLSAGVDILA